MIEIKNLSKKFHTAQGEVQALNDLNLTINDGDIFGIIGMSGAGKSTLVRTINMLERPTEGTVSIDGTDVGSLSNRELRKFRRDITMIFQGFNLLQQRNCLKNVCFPLELAGLKKSEAVKKAQELLELVGLGNKAKAFPSQLSGGQQQRVAIARALATNPKVLLCDEATSALDPKTTNSILDLIRDINKKLGITVIIITHQMSVVESVCNRVAILENGVIVEQGQVEEIFSRPKSTAAKKLVYPESTESAEEISVKQQNVVRLVFNGGQTANRPIVAALAEEKGVKANICYASTKSVGEKAFGVMLLSFDTRENLGKALQYFAEIPGITVEEIN